MNRDETARLLRARSALTSQPYGDETIDAWQRALDQWTLAECRSALTAAARSEKLITPRHIIERLPAHSNITPPPVHDWSGPTERGRRSLELIREHLRDHHGGEHQRDCPSCHATPTRQEELL